MKKNWRIEAITKGCSIMIYDPDAGNGNGGLVTLISDSGFSRKEDIEHANLIVKAVNEHDDLKLKADKYDNLVALIQERTEDVEKELTIAQKKCDELTKKKADLEAKIKAVKIK